MKTHYMENSKKGTRGAITACGYYSGANCHGGLTLRAYQRKRTSEDWSKVTCARCKKHQQKAQEATRNSEALTRASEIMFNHLTK